MIDAQALRGMHVLATDAAVNALERVRRGDPNLEVPGCPFAFLCGKGLAEQKKPKALDWVQELKSNHPGQEILFFAVHPCSSNLFKFLNSNPVDPRP